MLLVGGSVLTDWSDPDPPPASCSAFVTRSKASRIFELYVAKSGGLEVSASLASA